MYRPSRSMSQEEDEVPLSTGSTKTNSFETHGVYNQMFPVGFSMDPTIFQQQCDLVDSFVNYPQTSSVGITQAWTTQQQSYVDLPSTSPIHQGLPQLVPRPSVTQSLVSDEGDDTSEPASPQDEAIERRKERRRAQNRAAQRAFRAWKEGTIKESSARLELLQEELVRLEFANGNLSDAVSRLRSEVARLREENAALRGRRANGIIVCGYARGNKEGPR